MKLYIEKGDIPYLLSGLSHSLEVACLTDLTMPSILFKTMARLSSLYNKSLYRDFLVELELEYIHAIDLKIALVYARKFEGRISNSTRKVIDKWCYILKEALDAWQG